MKRISEYNTDIFSEAIEEYKKEHHWENGWKPVDNTDILNKYTEYIPNDEFFQKIIDLDPIIEIGSGNGYWSNKLDSEGADVIAVDPYPPRHRYFETIIDNHKAVLDHPKRNVLLCHPVMLEWTEELLELIPKGNYFIYVGEEFPGQNSTANFFNILDKSFEEKERYDIIDWNSQNAFGIIYKKCESLNVRYSHSSNKILKKLKSSFDSRYLQEKEYLTDINEYNYP